MGGVSSCLKTDSSHPSSPVQQDVPLQNVRPSRGQRPAGETATFESALQQSASAGPSRPPSGSGSSESSSASGTGLPSQQPRLPPLDMSAIDNNPRLRPPSPGAHSPETPSPATMAKYAHPDTLPSPDGSLTFEGHNYVKYGREKVLANGQEDYEKVRRQMAEVPPRVGENYSKPQKYLASLEHRNGNSVSTVIYKSEGSNPGASASRPIPDKLHGIPLASNAELQPRTWHVPATDVSPARTVAAFPGNRGALTSRGGSVSAATIGAHELGHAVQGPGGDKTSLGRFTNKAEKSVVTTIENPVAHAHGEGLNDQHGRVFPFETADITSNVPINPQAASAIEKYKPELKMWTKDLDGYKADASKPTATQSGVFDQRDKIMNRLKQEAGNLPLASATSSS